MTTTPSKTEVPFENLVEGIERGSARAVYDFRTLIADSLWQLMLLQVAHEKPEAVVELMTGIMGAMVDSIEETHKEVLGLAA